MGHKGEYNSLELIPLLDKSNQLNSENHEVRSKNETVSLKLIPLAKCLETNKGDLCFNFNMQRKSRVLSSTT